MAQYLTIDEAAAKLGLSVADFKKRLRTEWVGKVRPFQDGATQRFRASEIDELARSIGLGSSEELQLADSDELELPTEINLDLDDAPPKAPERTQAVGRPSKHTQAAPPPDDEPLKLDDDSLKLESDEVFLLTPDEPPAQPLKPGSDSDVRLEKSDGKKKPAANVDDEESILTDEFDLPTGSSVKLTGKSGRLSSSKLLSSDSGKGKAQPGDAEPDSSEFELSLAPDSDEFELSLTSDSSEEVSLGESIEPKKAGQSGINLNRPADSGVSLEKKGKPPAKPAKQEDSDEEIDFELSLDAPGSGKSATKLGSGKRLQADSDSEFELTLEEPSDLALDESDAGTAEKKDDIFEATDFEIPALDDDSASEAIALDEGDTDLESSDFDLALDDAEASVDDDSASQVVALDDEEDAPRPKNKKKKGVEEDSDVVDLDDLDEDDSAGAALRGVRADEEDDLEVTEAAEDDERPVVVSAEAAPWGALPALLMFPTMIVLFFGAIMAYELLHSAWGYSQPNKPTTPLVNWAAETTGMK